MAEGCLSLTQVVWPALSSAPSAVSAAGVCREQPGPELDPDGLRRRPWSPAPAHSQRCAVSKAAAQLLLALSS